MIPELNKRYRYLVKFKPWQETAFRLVEENYFNYRIII